MMKHIHSAGIITYFIQNNEPAYLLLHHTAGHWDFPKGTMEPGETKQQTAIRELYEETGLNADLDTHFEAISDYFYTHYQHGVIPKTVYYFVGEAHTQEVLLSHEHTNYIWLPYDQALEKITHDRSKKILEEADKYIRANLKLSTGPVIIK